MIFSTLGSYAIYLSVFVLSSLFLFIATRAKRPFSLIFCLFSASPLALLSCIRAHSVGTDYPYYLNHFRQMINRVDFPTGFASLDSRFEYGYNLLIFLISRFTENVYFVSFLVYLIIAILIQTALSYSNDRRYIAYGHFLYLCAFWLYSFNGLRQSMAMPIILLAFAFLIHKNRLPSFLTLTVAATIHIAALSFSPIYFLFNRNIITFKKILLFIFLSIVAVFFINEIANYVGYGHYLMADIGRSDILPTKAIQSVCVLLPFLFFSYHYRSNPQIKFGFLIVLAISACIILSIYASVITRLTFYLEILLVPLAMRIHKALLTERAALRGLWLLYICMYFVFYRFFYVYSSSSNVLPYTIL